MVERDLRRIERAVNGDLGKLLQEEIREEKRVPIPSNTKEAVYERAKERCERCGMPLKRTDKGGHFHHLKKPTAKSRPSTIQFLCATCHMNYGHDHKSRSTGYDHLTDHPIKKTYIVRKKVRKNPSSPYWKMKSKTPTKETRRKTTSKKIKSKTKKTRKRRPKTPLERLTKQLEKDFL